MITFNNVSKQYDGHTALSNLTFSIEPKEMVFITGHSGAGKSTLLKLAAGIEPATRGQIEVDSKLLQNLSARQNAYLRRNIGIIFQDPHLLSNRTVYDNVSMPLVIAGLKQHDIRKRVQAALNKVGLLSKASQYPASLSSGEKQRVGIARAVVNKPRILLADEPTGNLDPALSIEIFNLLEAFNAVGVTVVIATHDLSLISTMAHRCIHIKNGLLSGEVY